MSRLSICARVRAPRTTPPSVSVDMSNCRRRRLVMVVSLMRCSRISDVVRVGFVVVDTKTAVTADLHFGCSHARGRDQCSRCEKNLFHSLSLGFQSIRPNRGIRCGYGSGFRSFGGILARLAAGHGVKSSRMVQLCHSPVTWRPGPFDRARSLRPLHLSRARGQDTAHQAVPGPALRPCPARPLFG